MSQVLAEKLYRKAMTAIDYLEQSGFQARLAGGCVRDRLLGRLPKDYDVATDALPEQICSVFEQKGLKTVKTGWEHGTVTVIIKHDPIEITTLRRDVATDGRRAVVAFSRDFREDAARRDFTVNAMFEDRHGKVYDFFDGRKHLLEERCLCFVGEANQRIREDYLRILRLYRFWAQLGLSPTEEALQACSLNATDLTKLSQERITSELRSLLSAAQVHPVVTAMQRDGILAILLDGGLDASLDWQLDALAPPVQTSTLWLARFAYLLRKKRERFAKSKLKARFRLAAKEARTLEQFVSIEDKLSDLGNENASLMALLDNWQEAIDPQDSPLDWLTIIYENFGLHDYSRRKLELLINCERKYLHLRKAPLPVTAKDLIGEGICQAGPKLGRVLSELKVRFRNGVWQHREQGLALARQISQSI